MNKYTLTFLLLISLACSSFAKSQKDVYVNNDVEYYSYLDKEKNLVGDGSLYVFDNRIDYTSTEYKRGAKTDVLKGASVNFKNCTLKGTFKISFVPESNGSIYKMSVVDGEIIIGGISYSFENKDFPIDLSRKGYTCDYILASTGMKHISQVKFPNHFEDKDLILEDSLADVYSIGLTGEKRLKYFKSPQGVEYYVDERYDRELTEIRKGDHVLKIGDGSFRIDNDNKYTYRTKYLDTRWREFPVDFGNFLEELSKKQNLKGSVIVKEWEIPELGGIFNEHKVKEALFRGEDIVILKDSTEEDRDINFRRTMIDYFFNPDKYSFKTFDEYCQDPVKLIYGGKDVKNDYFNYKNRLNKKAKEAEQQEYAQRCKKYGKKYVDIFDNHGMPVVGMPEELLLQYGCYLNEQGVNYKWYDVYLYGVYCKVTNGRVSNVRKKY